MKLDFHPAAELEALEAESRYADVAPALGQGFTEELRAATRLILEYPRAAPKVNPHLRARVLRRFPYSVVYSVEEERVFILAVAHHSRRPEYWSRRRCGSSEASV